MCGYPVHTENTQTQCGISCHLLHYGKFDEEKNYENNENHMILFFQALCTAHSFGISKFCVIVTFVWHLRIHKRLIQIAARVSAMVSH